MQTAVLSLLRTAHRPLTRRACRIIGGSRHPLPHRSFHRSAVYRVPDTPKPQEDDADTSISKPAEVPQLPGTQPESQYASEDGPAEDGPIEQGPIEEDVPVPADGDEGALLRKMRAGRSGYRRTPGNRSKAPEGVPPITIPSWFWEKNVKLVGEPNWGRGLIVEAEVRPTTKVQSEEVDTGAGMTTQAEVQSVSQVESEGVNPEPDVPPVDGVMSEQVKEEAEPVLVFTEESKDSNTESGSSAEAADGSGDRRLPTIPAKYTIHSAIYKEISASIRASLTLKAPKGHTQALKRPVTLLDCPKSGGETYLDSVVEAIANDLEADLIRLDAQDIAHIVGPYIDEQPLWSSPNSRKTGMLGYETQVVAGEIVHHDEDWRPETNTTDNDFSDDSKDDNPLAMTIKSLMKAGDMRKNVAKINIGVLSPGGQNPVFGLQGFDPFNKGAQPGSQDQWTDLKFSTAFDALITSAEAKRAASTQMEACDGDEAAIDSESRPLIVQLQDYKEILGTMEAAFPLQRLRACVDKRWQEGSKIVLVGTSSLTEDYSLASLRRRSDSVQGIQSDAYGGETKTIIVPPLAEHNTAFESDTQARFRRINLRHIEEMLIRLAEPSLDIISRLDLEKNLPPENTLEEAPIAYGTVHRIATTILGLEDLPETIDGAVFSDALKIIASSDEAKTSWYKAELKELKKIHVALGGPKPAPKGSIKRLSELRKQCNTHEAKLLSGVVEPKSIRTTFADIRAPEETIEALKTLTSLSLTRPEAFKYGVLATDKIPGLLLYGPPGTGKTLLAKAVAKESGATILEVTAADLNDMFVGNSEKNVRAVFSLAKKLSPCVVFIDEADALFSARHESNNRSAHRELINQFLREWDGLTTDTSAFIMVATNRPFDIDEAVLRRLPRRILVDLPIEKDREAILKIQLKDENLDDSVSITQLAKDTPFYSGSDLKNVAVAAALACIREENALAALHVGDKPYVYPERRTLTNAHFVKALEEISASISEDMSTLSAIRKFDEKYGDRKGRRKKGPGIGFGGTKSEENDSEAVRVRKMAA